MIRRFAIACALLLVAVSAIVPVAHAHNQQASEQLTCTQTTFYCPLSTSDSLVHSLEGLPTPELIGPAPPAPVVTARPISKTVTYSVETRGDIKADLDSFKTLANQTLNDARGWQRLGVQFNEVVSGGQFSLVLSSADQMTTFSASACDNYYSCRVGRYVIINQDRWQGATDTWNNAGGNLRDYRHMVINHETGHWLGHNHAGCPGAGQPAPLMQQQSYNLASCTFNPWPLDSELWSTTLGI